MHNIIIFLQEEQRVIETKIRITKQEVLDEEERMIKRKEMSSSRGIIEPNEAEYFSRAGMCLSRYVSVSGAIG